MKRLFVFLLLWFMLPTPVGASVASNSIYFRCTENFEWVAGYNPGNHDQIERSWVFTDANKVAISETYVHIGEMPIPTGAKYVWYPTDTVEPYKVIPSRPIYCTNYPVVPPTQPEPVDPPPSSSTSSTTTSSVSVPSSLLPTAPTLVALPTVPAREALPFTGPSLETAWLAILAGLMILAGVTVTYLLRSPIKCKRD